MSESNSSTCELNRPEPKLVSIVVPVFNEQDNIAPLAQAVASVLIRQGYELIFVDDGSTDQTFAKIEQVASSDKRVRGISLARNFGQQNALAAGMNCATGDVVVTMDGDMQHPPELLADLICKWREGFNVVQTQRLACQDIPLLKRMTSALFYKLFSWISGVKIAPGLADFRLLDISVVRKLLEADESRLFLRGMLSWMGYRQAILPYTANRRFSGKPKYTLRKMLRLARAGVIGYSNLPVRLGQIMGLVSGIAGLIVLGISMQFTLAGGGLLMFAIVFFLLGIQGGYLVRIFERVQNRPTYLIERVTDSFDSDTQDK